MLNVVQHGLDAQCSTVAGKHSIEFEFRLLDNLLPVGENCNGGPIAMQSILTNLLHERLKKLSLASSLICSKVIPGGSNSKTVGGSRVAPVLHADA